MSLQRPTFLKIIFFKKKYENNQGKLVTFLILVKKLELAKNGREVVKFFLQIKDKRRPSI
jgi:hypothetical protein